VHCIARAVMDTKLGVPSSWRDVRLWRTGRALSLINKEHMNIG
jgi:hypothetical protein